MSIAPFINFFLSKHILPDFPGGEDTYIYVYRLAERLQRCKPKKAPGMAFPGAKEWISEGYLVFLLV
jgi:hypothetical protein